MTTMGKENDRVVSKTSEYGLRSLPRDQGNEEKNRISVFRNLGGEKKEKKKPIETARLLSTQI